MRSFGMFKPKVTQSWLLKTIYFVLAIGMTLVFSTIIPSFLFTFPFHHHILIFSPFFNSFWLVRHFSTTYSKFLDFFSHFSMPTKRKSLSSRITREYFHSKWWTENWLSKVKQTLQFLWPPTFCLYVSWQPYTLPKIRWTFLHIRYLHIWIAHVMTSKFKCRPCVAL